MLEFGHPLTSNVRNHSFILWELWCGLLPIQCALTLYHNPLCDNWTQ